VYNWLSYRLPIPVFLWLLGIAALAALWVRRQEKRRRLLVLTVAFLLLTLYCMPVTGQLLLRPLEAPYPPLAHRPEGIQAIVVLGGGVRASEGEGLPALPDEAGMHRCLRAAEMYHQGPPCPVLVSGGRPDPNRPEPPCSHVMHDLLLRLGVSAADVVEEDTSANTYENAVESVRILRERGLARVVLVTDASHLERAVRCFRKQGVDPVPCGCLYRTLNFEGTVKDFLPDPGQTRAAHAALHEWLGLAWYALRGRA
jgi:uncharacterized SAM-binding protein YcdF (DUF218 family)